MRRSQSVGSLEYVPIVIVAKLNGVVYDPTSLPVEMAFTASDQTAPPTSFTAASWDTDSSGATPLYVAKVLVGPGGAIVLTVGVWNPWVKITASPEVPLLQGPPLDIY